MPNTLRFPYDNITCNVNRKKQGLKKVPSLFFFTFVGYQIYFPVLDNFQIWRLKNSHAMYVLHHQYSLLN